MDIATQQDIEYLINHPGIYPSTGFPPGETAIIGTFFENPRNVAFTCMYGGMLFNQEEGDVFSGHFLFLPGTKGVDILTAAKGMLQEMFTKHGASVIRGYPPRENRAVRVIGNALGYHKIDNAIFTDDFGRDCETYEVKLSWLH